MFNAGLIQPTNKVLGTPLFPVSDYPPNYPGLAFWYQKRQAGTAIIEDKIAGEMAKAVGGKVGYFDGNSYIEVASSGAIYFDVNQPAIIKFRVDPDDVNNNPLFTFNGTNGYKVYIFFNSANVYEPFVIVFNDQTNKYTYRGDNMPSYAEIVSIGYFECEIYYNGQGVYDVNNFSFVYNGTNKGAKVGGDSLLSVSLNWNVIGVAPWDSNTRFQGRLSYFYFSQKNSEYYLNNNFYNSIDGQQSINHGVTFTDSLEITPKLDKPYYHLATGEQVIDPQYTLPEGATLHPAGRLHNLIDSFITFNPDGSADAKFDIFDRGNTTIFAQAARDSVYYDSTDRTSRSRFHISELTDINLFRSYFNTGYKYRVFFRINPDHGSQLYIDQIAVYSSDQSGLTLSRIQNWAHE